MFKGKVVRSFKDRVTGKRYPAGSTYITDSEERMNEIIAAGETRGRVYVEFEQSELPPGVEGRESFEEMTVVELRSYAESIGLELTATKKADIIAEIEAADGDE